MGDSTLTQRVGDETDPRASPGSGQPPTQTGTCTQ
jgi:hypothetical protein